MFAVNVRSNTFCVIRVGRRVQLNGCPIFGNADLYGVLLVRLVVHLGPTNFARASRVNAISRVATFVSQRVTTRGYGGLKGLLSTCMFDAVRVSYVYTIRVNRVTRISYSGTKRQQEVRRSVAYQEKWFLAARYLRVTFQRLSHVLGTPRRRNTVRVCTNGLRRSHRQLRATIHQTSLFGQGTHAYNRITITNQVSRRFTRSHFPTKFTLYSCAHGTISLRGSVTRTYMRLCVGTNLRRRVRRRGARFFQVSSLLHFAITYLYTRLFGTTTILSTNPVARGTHNYRATSHTMLLSRRHFSSRTYYIRNNTRAYKTTACGGSFHFYHGQSLPTQLDVVLRLGLLFGLALFFTFFYPLLPYEEAFRSGTRPTRKAAN